MASVALNRLDKFLILGSDGLWEVFENEEVVSMVAGWREEGREEGVIASLIVDAALVRIAEGLKMSVQELKEVKEGRERRRKHDDITVVVLFLGEEREGDCPLEGSEAWEEELGAEVDDFIYPEEEEEGEEGGRGEGGGGKGPRRGRICLGPGRRGKKSCREEGGKEGGREGGRQKLVYARKRQ